MEKEISNGAMLGIVLIALAAIIGLGFGVFAIARGTANEGVANVQESLDVVSEAAFSDFDQRIITGTQVVSALDTFEGKPYAILIATQATKDRSATEIVAAPTDGDWRSAVNNLNTGAGAVEAYGGVAPTFIPNGSSGPGVPPVVLANIGVDRSSGAIRSELTFVNYNALLGRNTGLAEVPATTFKMPLSFDGSVWRTTDGFLTESGVVVFNNTTRNVIRSGMMEFVPSGARFQAYLIKDMSGTIMGIAFEQLHQQ